MEVRILGMSDVKMDQLNWGPVDGGTMSIVFVITTIITNICTAGSKCWSGRQCGISYAALSWQILQSWKDWTRQELLFF